MEARMLLTALEATPVFFERPLMTDDRLPPKIWLKILEPSVMSAPARLLRMLPALPAWSPRAFERASAPLVVEAFFCMAPRSEGRALVMTEETCLESSLRFFAMVLTASLPVSAPKMLVKSMIFCFKLIGVEVQR